MFLSSLILNPKSREARRDLNDVYEMHRTLMTAFPDKDDGGPGQVLWRLDNDRRSGTSCVLVQSEKEPNWQSVSLRASDYLAVDVREEIPPAQTKLLPEWKFHPGQCLSFRLRANPTVKREGKRHGLLTEEDQTAWLIRKAGQAGFRVLSVSLTPERPHESGKGNGRQLKFVSTLFEGQLVITDPAEFISKGIVSGIGSGKAFGFGLLSVARMS